NKAAKLTVPSEAKIKNLLAAIDYKKIKVDISKSEIYLQEKGMEIDLGGIAKGYAADRVIEVIRSQGIKAALAAIAGDIKGFGLTPDLQGWKVGIQNPRPTGVRSIRLIGVDSYRDSEGQVDATRLRGSRVKEEDIFATLSLKDSAISTSGDYQRYFMENGKRFHHILDPQTGYPAHGVISVSIIAPDGYMTDGLSTGVFVLGVEKGIRLLESMGIDGIIVDTENKISVTKNLEGKINIGNL
ncbi:MAG: FAD:protein FMN transferase, partial [Nitrospirae bacterium]|nr:FAD:protein FMN transferase [Nitrospirota bacterium]